MIGKCEMCNNLADVTTIVEGCESYPLCDICFKIRENKPNSNTIKQFLRGFGLSEVENNIVDARKRRAKGERLWK